MSHSLQSFPIPHSGSSGPRPIVLIDMDAVLADFYGAAVALLEAEYPAITPISKPSHYRVEEDYPTIHHETIRHLFHRPGFFATLPVIDGALEGWATLLKLGYEPQICSSPMLEHVSCEQEKREWIAAHLVPRFGQTVLESAHITRQKAAVKGAALIDDRPEIAFSDQASWQHIVFSQPYNTHLDTPYRLRSWSDPNLENVVRQAVAHAQNN